MAWSYGGLSVKEMTDPMIQGAIDELQAEKACREPHAEAVEECELCYMCKRPVEFEDGAKTSKCRHYIRFDNTPPASIFTQRNDGSSTSFYSCGKCGASVQPQDRETHVEWHREHGR